MLRYFATNRGMETLAGSVLRDTRTKLEQGGYFFVDMKKYMSYYFAVTDEENIPPASLELKSKDSVFGSDFLGSAKVGTVVICVHGFNVELREASTWFRILTDTMRHDPQMAHRFVHRHPAVAMRGKLHIAVRCVQNHLDALCTAHGSC